MDTPIYDFVKKYIQSDAQRLHMPGHKGIPRLGCEAFDITEIEGADSLYESNGIIKQSEDNASTLFECNTYFSTEGSSQCIRAMLYLCTLKAKGRPVIAAGRNAHKTFLSAAALCDFDIDWLYPNADASYLSCELSARSVEKYLDSTSVNPCALYITSPDYLGNTSQIKEIADVCHKHGVLLAVDNAHGAYLKFLPKSQHPIDLGADICCDSAHKTLPALTGGAYLHISPAAPAFLKENSKNALALFGSTSPSYLILQSLDLVNEYLADGYKEKLACFIYSVNELKERLIQNGYALIGNEPLKLTINAKKYGYTGYELSRILSESAITVEFCDPDYTVMMLTPESDIEILENALLAIPKKTEIVQKAPIICKTERILSVKGATFTEHEEVDIDKSCGRILASASVGCPPAIPIVVCGERIDKKAIKCFKYYGIKKCTVVKE